VSHINQIKKILTRPVPVSIVTVGTEGCHSIGIRNCDITVVNNETLLIPARGMRKTENNIKDGSDIKLIIGNWEMTMAGGAEIGYYLTGNAEFHYTDSYYELIKSRFDWAQAALVVTIQRVEELI
jgi:hypothetical protein